MMQGSQSTTGSRQAADKFAAGAIFLCLALAIGTVGAIYITHQIADARMSAQDQLSAIADLKVREISNWYRERRTDAELAHKSLMIESHVSRLLADQQRDRMKRELQEWMDTQREGNRYSKIMLFDTQGAPKLWSPADLAPADRISVADNKDFQAALLAKGVVTTDLHRSGRNPGFIHFSHWIPVNTKKEADAPADGVLLLQIDAAEFLFPLIQSWPTLSRTAETVLLRREGNDAVALNELRHRANTAFNLRIPINTPKRIPATMAVAGHSGITEGLDYRDVPVLAAIRPVTGTPWTLIAKIDQDEVYAGLRYRAWITGLACLMAILATALGVRLMWRRRENRWLREHIDKRRQTEEALRDTMQRLQLAATSAKLGVWEWDLMTNILVWDDRMYEIYDVSRDSGRTTFDTWRESLHPDDVTRSFKEIDAAHRGEKEYDTEFRIVRSDGAVRTIKANALVIRDKDGMPTRQIGLNRDITEQKRSDQTRESTIELLRICNQAQSMQELARELTAFFQRFTGCEAVGIRLRQGDDYPYYETCGFPAEFVQAENKLCVLDPAGQVVRDCTGNPVLECMCGNILRGRFDPTKPFFTEHGSFWSNCTTDLLACTNDADRQARTRNRCNGEGYESVALVPMRLAGQILGLLQFNSRQKGRFTLEMIRLAEQMADYVAIAFAKQQAEEALRRSKEQFRSYFELPLIGIAITSPDKGWMETNERLCDILGYAREELMAMTWSQITHPADLQADLDNFDRVKAGQIDSYSIEKRFVRKDGRTIFTDLSVRCVRKATGAIDYFVALIQDITERKLAVEALRASQVELDAIFENAPVAMLLVDGERRVRKANQAALGLAGGVSVDVIGKHSGSALRCVSSLNSAGGCGYGPACHECSIRRTVQDTIETGAAHSQVEAALTVVRGAAIQEISLVISTTLLVAGVERMVLVCAQDVTERKRLEAQLMQAQKMEAIGRLAGGIAHDFRNQLTVVKGYSEMLLRNSLIKDGKEKLVGEILNAAHRGTQLTGQLLAFSRKDMLRPTVVNLGKIVADLAGPMSRLVGEDIVVTTSGDGEDLMVDIATAQFEHAMMNLAANSRDAMPHGGELTMDTACVDVDAALAAELPDSNVGPYVRVTVRDSGIGMDAATQARLFEPFFTTKERGQGTGLGLPMVYGFVRQSGGFITVWSEPGKGTSFSLHFPRVATAADPDARGDRQSGERPLSYTSGGKETVLVVEDEEAIRWLVTQNLRELGYTVIETGDARQAVQIVENSGSDIDLLISDVVMPGMSGVELATRIRRRIPGIPVLFVSGYGTDDLNRCGVDLDHAKLLVKPFQITTLFQIVRQLLDERHPVG